jgi:magnesium transporter
MIEIFYYDDGLKKGNVEDIDKIKHKPIWVDITNINKSEQAIIKKNFRLHPLTIEDLYDFSRVKIEEFNNYVFCVFFGVKKSKTIDLIELDFIIGRNFLITNHKTEVNSFNNLKNNKEKLSEIFERGIDFLFHNLLDNEIDNYFPVLEKIDDDIEEVEDEITIKAKPELLAKILKIKRTIVYIKKHVMPQREKILYLTKYNTKFISKEALPYFRDIYDHSIRVSDTIENYREAIGSTFDISISAVSNSLNEVMKILGIIATISLPLTIISSIYGTNFNVLPGSGSIYGFWMMISSMILIIIIIVFVFKKKKWF